MLFPFRVSQYTVRLFPLHFRLQSFKIVCSLEARQLKTNKLTRSPASQLQLLPLPLLSSSHLLPLSLPLCHMCGGVYGRVCVGVCVGVCGCVWVCVGVFVWVCVCVCVCVCA